MANIEFLSANPAARRSPRQPRFRWIAAQNLEYHEGGNTQQDIEGHETDWIAEHRDQVDRRLETAPAAA